MKKSILFTLLIFHLLIACAQTKKISRLGIVNPTAGNLSNTINLINKGYLQADSIAIVGIFHQSQASSIASSEEFIRKSSYKNIAIEKIQGRVSLDSLFVENGCTKEFEEIFDKVDAIILFGGADIPPSVYGEETFLTTELISGGKNWELSFLFHLIGGSQNINFEPFLEKNPDFPILGICLGMQEMNVASGGSLYQDIPFQVHGKTTFESLLTLGAEHIHKNYWNRMDNENEYSFIHFHPIKIPEESFLKFNGVSATPTVASVHHQSPKKLGKGFAIAATSIDGKVVEALQHTQFKNVYGIQFHTDFSVLYDEGRTFNVSPSEIVELSEDTKMFHKLFWEDFSRRLVENR
ncbi:MAG: gamma-glutamyl-gamma-aminobutyrate hydrolase family protein [Bacteroidia bacterium]|nr:gamma-glutamyl-gamma-aminobutyrate hydrolase family protein [Bacteroidia bacterium]